MPCAAVADAVASTGAEAAATEAACRLVTPKTDASEAPAPTAAAPAASAAGGCASAAAGVALYDFVPLEPPFVGHTPLSACLQLLLPPPRPPTAGRTVARSAQAGGKARCEGHPARRETKTSRVGSSRAASAQDEAAGDSSDTSDAGGNGSSDTTDSSAKENGGAAATLAKARALAAAALRPAETPPLTPLTVAAASPPPASLQRYAGARTGSQPVGSKSSVAQRSFEQKRASAHAAHAEGVRRTLWCVLWVAPHGASPAAAVWRDMIRCALDSASACRTGPQDIDVADGVTSEGPELQALRRCVRLLVCSQGRVTARVAHCSPSSTAAVSVVPQVRSGWHSPLLQRCGAPFSPRAAASLRLATLPP